MKLSAAELEEKEYTVFTAFNEKHRLVMMPLSVDSDTKTVKYQVVIPVKLDPSQAGTNLDLEPIDTLEERTFTGPFFVLDKDGNKVLEVL